MAGLRIRCALIGIPVFRAFSDPQAVGLVINVPDLATKTLLLTETSASRE
jgi:hypothetical protein